MKFSLLFIITFIFPMCVLTTTNISNCGPRIPFPNDVHIEGCDKSPCKLYRGTYGVTHINLTIPFDVESFEPFLRASFGFITVNHELSEDIKKGCNFIRSGTKTYCPLEAGDVIVYELKQFIEKDTPTMYTPKLTTFILDQDKNILACYNWVTEIV